MINRGNSGPVPDTASPLLGLYSLDERSKRNGRGIDWINRPGSRLTIERTMATYIGLLRAVNLAGHNKIGMADLRKFLTRLGLQDVKTLLQSGNFVCRSDVRNAADLERLVEGGATKQLGLTTDILVRSDKEWKALIAENPFPKEAKLDPSHLLAVVLKGAPDRASVKALQDAIKGREVVDVRGRCAYIVYRDGIGRSRLTSAVIEKHLSTRGTGRNWNTVLKLDALASG